MTSLHDDPRVRRGMERQLELRRKALEDGARPLGWKLGLGTPTTWLRIVRRGGLDTAYTSIDGRRWVRGGTWTHSLTDEQIALVAMGLAPGQHTPGTYTVQYDYVRVYSLEDSRG